MVSTRTIVGAINGANLVHLLPTVAEKRAFFVFTNHESRVVYCIREVVHVCLRDAAISKAMFMTLCAHIAYTSRQLCTKFGIDTTNIDKVINVCYVREEKLIDF